MARFLRNKVCMKVFAKNKIESSTNQGLVNSCRSSSILKNVHAGSKFDHQAKPFFENKLWSIKTLSRFLDDVPEATIRDWVYKRQIPFRKVRGLIRFVPFEIFEWIKKGDGYGY